RRAARLPAVTPTRLVAALGLAAGLLACAPGRSQEQSAADPLALVERLIDERPWTRRGVERTTGVALVPNEAAANRYYSLWISERGAGSLARVELREAGPEATRGGLLILDLDPEAAGLPLARIPERFGRDFAF